MAGTEIFILSMLRVVLVLLFSDRVVCQTRCVMVEADAWLECGVYVHERRTAF